MILNGENPVLIKGFNHGFQPEFRNHMLRIESIHQRNGIDGVQPNGRSPSQCGFQVHEVSLAFPKGKRRYNVVFEGDVASIRPSLKEALLLRVQMTRNRRR
jgi:hypothetical protein